MIYIRYILTSLFFLIGYLSYGQVKNPIYKEVLNIDSVANKFLIDLIQHNLPFDSLLSIRLNLISNYHAEDKMLILIQLGKKLFRESRYSFSAIVFDSAIKISSFLNNKNIRTELNVLLARASLYNGDSARAKLILNNELERVSEFEISMENQLRLQDALSEYFIVAKEFKKSKVYQKNADSLASFLSADNESYIFHLRLSIYFNSLIKNYKEASKSNLKLISTLTPAAETYAELLSNQGLYYFELLKLDSSESYYRQSINLLVKKYPKNSIRMLYKLFNYANTVYELQQYETADSIFYEIDSLVRDKLDLTKSSSNKDYWGIYIVNLCKILTNLQRKTNAEIDYFRWVSKIDSLLSISEIESSLESQSKIIAYDVLFRYFQKSKHIRANIYFEKLYGLYLENVKSAVLGFSDIELSTFLVNNKYGGFNSYFNYYDPELMKGEYLKWLFDFSIVNKGIGLRKKLFLEGSLNNGFDYIKKQLKSDEIAVNFYKYNKIVHSNIENKEITYIALVVSPILEAPIFFNLCSENELDSFINNRSNGNILNSVIPDDFYRGSSVGLRKNSIDNLQKIYNTIWKPILDKFGNISKVYYSSTGLLNEINLSILKSSKSTYSNENIDFYNLIFLDEISNVKGNFVDSIQKVLLVGGLDYGKKLNVSEGWSDLIGSKLEVEEINLLLKENNVNCELLTNKMCYKKNLFQRLEQNHFDIIHISTHGFYHLNDQEGASILDPLSSSGLVLSHANLFSRNNFSSDEGILYASELRDFKLNNTKLLVISACQSGLGVHRQNNEGVYGFQWVLKHAGVEKILISLWPVPDIPTMKLLKEFYINLSIRQLEPNSALKEAQNKVKVHYPEYSSWAGFVLLN